MNIGKKLSEVRKSAHLSQARLAEHMNRRGFDVKAYTICKWEAGTSSPTVEAFLAICDICRVEDIRQTFEAGRKLRLYDIPVSAGRGNYLDESSCEMIDADELVPDCADFAVRVSGDSMMPRFVDRQIVFIHGQQEIAEGELGVFLLNDEAYLKKSGNGCLISLNPSYSPIPVGADDEFRVLGKVVG